MKKPLLYIFLGLIAIAPKAKAQDPITLIIKQGIKQVIVAVDLKIQRLQTKTIWLQNAQKVVENAMSKMKLNEITDWVQKQKDLYQNYFDELWKVKDVLSYYHRIKEITTDQIAIVNEYHKAWNGVRQDGHFTSDEVQYIGQVYDGIINASLKNLDQIGLVINSFTTQMTDAKRLEIINHAADAMQTNLSDLRSFNSQNILLSLQRSKDENDIAAVQKMYGLNK
jgi:predicted transcriptional regulator YheO